MNLDFLQLNDPDKPQEPVVAFRQYVPSTHPNGVSLVVHSPQETLSRTPLAGSGGRLLWSLLNAQGHSMDACAHYSAAQQFSKTPLPPSDPNHNCLFEGASAGAQCQPVYVFLGKEASEWATQRDVDVEEERGAPFKVFNGVGLFTYHPCDLFKQFHLSSVVLADILKAVRLAHDGWKPLEKKVIFLPSYNDIIDFLNRTLQLRPFPLACDIETFENGSIKCIGFATSPQVAFVIPFVDEKRGPRFSSSEESFIWRLLHRVLALPLVGHNAVHFDFHELAKHGIVSNFTDDTMFSHWECYPESQKSLGFCLSLYTDESYHKNIRLLVARGKLPYWEEYRYCGLDCCGTLQIQEAIEVELKERPPGVREHYLFNIRVVRAFQYMAMHGVRFDEAKRTARLHELEEQAAKCCDNVNSMLGFKINVRSHQQVKDLLYEKWRLPIKYKKVKTDEGVEDRETADYLSMLELARENKDRKISILAIAALRRLYKRISSLSKIGVKDGRCYFQYGLVSTETGRAAGYKPTQGYGKGAISLGIQPQNVDRRDRDLCLADDGTSWAKADLEGADSWTVAACCAALGDSTMLLDLQGGIKPAQALAIAQLFGRNLIEASTETLASYKKQLKEISKHETISIGDGRTTYDVMKAVSHGSNYAMFRNTMSKNVFKKSEGNLYIDPHDCEDFQKLYYKRYKGIPEWHTFLHAQLKKNGFLDSAAGTRRYFLDRLDAQETLRQALAHCPQAHTSFVTNRFLEALMWRKENRIYNLTHPALILKPINQVHDETDFLFQTARIDEARQVFSAMVNGKLSFWGVEFEIPFEVKYGPDWGHCEEEF